MTPAERKSRQRHQARVKVFGADGGSIDLTKVSTYDLTDELARCIQSSAIGTAHDIMVELSARLEAARRVRDAQRDRQQEAD